MLYRQIAHKLRVQGRTPETSERPRDKGTGCYHDVRCANPLHKHPQGVPFTLIELDREDVGDLESLLQQGAIVAVTAEAKPRAEVRKRE